MIWIIALAVATYARSLANGFISDDITCAYNYKQDKYKYSIMGILKCFNSTIDRIIWSIFKENAFIHHLVSIICFAGLCCAFYNVSKIFIPENVAFIATFIFTVHPCNAQIAGWISGRWYMLSSLFGLLAIQWNNLLPYFASIVFAQNIMLLPILLDIPLVAKLIAIYLYVLFCMRALGAKVDITENEVAFKKDNLKFYPRKLVVALKSYCYYFMLAFLPLKMGWFHEIGEPITDDSKRVNRHFWLCIGLVATLALFYKTPAFLGIVLFTLGIAPFSNVLTLALFTAERYMVTAIMGWSIFLAFLVYEYPVVAAVIITAYFLRTQLELWAYRDDQRLAINSLINFDKSGFAWNNVIRLLFMTNRPILSYGLALEAAKVCPEFPTTYYHMSQLNRCTDLSTYDLNLALNNLEKACYYGKHDSWWKELEKFKYDLKKSRIERFLQNVARNTAARYIQPPIERPIEADRPAVVGIDA